MRISRSSRIAALVAAVATSLALAVPSAASAQQTGLVNIEISGNTVQVPVAVAANICDVTVSVLTADLRDGSATCQADADGTAEAAEPGDVQTGPQEGLVNLDISGNTVQVPIAVAANVCDVTVAVLTADLRDGRADCEADADGTATAVRPGQGGPQGPPA